jgi:hypothetical protein
MRITSTLIALSLLIFSAVVFAGSFVYDDFSGSELNTSKWNITCGTVELGCVPIVGINTTTQTFQIEQPTPHGIGLSTATYLNLIGYNFTVNETLDFDVNYSKNIGNQVLGFQYDTFPPAPCFVCMGYWNGGVDIGNVAGLYHFKITFLSGKQIFINLTKPDNSTLTRFYSYSTDTPHFYPSAATGHDGVLRADYDNFVVTAPEPPTTTTTTTTSTTTSTTTTSSTTTTVPADADGDGVPDAVDKCSGTILPESVPAKRLLPYHYADIDGDKVFETKKLKKTWEIVDSNFDLSDTYGCSCEQILELKHGKNKGELKYGCSLGTIFLFKTEIGWARGLF